MPSLLERQLAALPGVLHLCGFVQTADRLVWERADGETIVYFEKPLDPEGNVILLGDGVVLRAINGILTNWVTEGRFMDLLVSSARTALDIMAALPKEASDAK